MHYDFNFVLSNSLGSFRVTARNQGEDSVLLAPSVIVDGARLKNVAAKLIDKIVFASSDFQR